MKILEKVGQSILNILNEFYIVVAVVYVNLARIVKKYIFFAGFDKVTNLLSGSSRNS